MKKLRIDIWSDIACPWCYVGKRRLESALLRFPHRAEVELVWRSFELDPSAPREQDTSVPYTERLARKYRTTAAEAQKMIDRMTAVARDDGLDFHFEKARPGNTFDAHRLLHLAATKGLQDALKERYFRAYLCEGEPIGAPEALVRLAAETGLDPELARATLATDAHASDVRADERQAAEIGIHGVPFFVLASRYAVSGAQSADLLLQALTKAWSDLPKGIETLAEGAACGPDGCD